MPFTRANDTNLYYEIHGDGPPLFLIAGFAQNCLIWQEILPELAKHFTVIRFDNRGCGQSDAPIGAYSIKMLAEDTVALLDVLGIESAHFIGQSMGTCIALQLCKEHPDRVKKALLCAPFAKLPPIACNNVAQQIKLLEEGIPLARLIRLNASWMLSNQLLADERRLEEYVELVQKNPYPPTLEGIIAQADALLSFDLRDSLRNIPHKIHLLVGECDIDTPVACAKLIEKRAGSCTMHIFPDMGHEFLYEIPESVAKHALEFLL